MVDHSTLRAKHFEPLLGFCICTYCRNLPEHADSPSALELRYGADWPRIACLHAHPTRPYAFYGCHKIQGHSGECDHAPRRTLCRHRGGSYPCSGINGEHCDCPVRDQDPGDEA